jgi:hypothetical protein
MKMTTWIRGGLLMVLGCAVGLGRAEARVKMVALPERAATVIRLDNPSATLIEEERVLTLQKGVNQVDFSWNGVSIDPDSIRLKVLDHPDRVTLLNVSYPPNEAALVWEISSTEPVEERVRISYLLANIDRLITYRFLANKPETQVDFKSYLVLRNFSGEDFGTSRVQLDYGEAFEQAIGHEETKQLLFLDAGKVPITKVWEFDSNQLPWDPEKVEGNVGIPVSYQIENKDASGLGKNALWGGKVRVFQDDGHGSTIVLGEDSSALVPVGEKMKVNIGDSRDIKVVQRKMKEDRINLRKNVNDQVVLYDTDEIIKTTLENFKDSPAVLTVIEYIPGQWDMVECNLKYEKKNSEKIEFQVALNPKEKKELMMHYQRRNLR